MIIVSNHLLTTTNLVFPNDIVVRLNLAWMKDHDTAVKTLEQITHDVYLDYPQGRSKPPKPVVTLDEALELAKRFPHVKYFAVSNVEEGPAIADIRARLADHIQLIPKIESERGVKNLAAIKEGARCTHAMLDKEDLYLDVDCDMVLFQSLIEEARAQASTLGMHMLELQGVVFA